MLDDVTKAFIPVLTPVDIQEIHRMIQQIYLLTVRHLDKSGDFHLFHKCLLQNGYMLFGTSEVAEPEKKSRG